MPYMRRILYPSCTFFENHFQFQLLRKLLGSSCLRTLSIGVPAAGPGYDFESERRLCPSENWTLEPVPDRSVQGQPYLTKDLDSGPQSRVYAFNVPQGFYHATGTMRSEEHTSELQ